MGFFILDKQLANIPDRGFLFLRNTLLFYSLSHYSRTESQTETQIHSLRVGWRNFFSSCTVCCVSFWFWREIDFGLHTYVLKVPYSCGVVLVFWLRREIVFGVTYILSVQYSCAVVSVFWLQREIVLKMRTRFYKNLIGLLYYDLLADVCILYDLTLFQSVFSINFFLGCDSF